MPHLFSFASHANDDVLPDLRPDELPQKRVRQSLLRRPLNLLRRQYAGGISDPPTQPATVPAEQAQLPEYFAPRRPSLPDNSALSKKAVPSLPRPQTFRRQESERRERLLEVQPEAKERRALSADRRQSQEPPTPLSPSQSVSIPSVPVAVPNVTKSNDADPVPPADANLPPSGSPPRQSRKDLPPLQIPDDVERFPLIDDDDEDNDRDHGADKNSVQEEFDRRWILNLSMHFRDKSNREKFFVTYAEKPNQWRRITISLDYRNAPEDSLEQDLSTLHFQRDKSFRIYEAIRDSLPEIQYYDTVTNLKLETTADDGKLHVHVREDANETIQYPSISLFDHVQCPRYCETSLDFDSHLSGFVYKVRLANRVVIKKEIPGPDTIDEFLYEVNALDSLLGAKNVVQLEGLVTDDHGTLVKALLISYASEGSLVDMIYDFRDTLQLPWYRREKWAKQIVTGLAEIHEAGFVQGDFTLSNIVINKEDDAQIIDINRRGCPVGWESPELSRLIESGQRIGMCIGVKTDIFQLGMVLWALAEEVDEPERVERPLPEVVDKYPEYFRDMVRICLSNRPQDRIGAKQLLTLFPDTAGLPATLGRVEFHTDMHVSDHSESTTHRSAKEYIDPDLAVTIDEVKDRRRPDVNSSDFNADQVTYVNPDSNPPSSTYRFESSGSWIIGRSRGRSPGSSRRRRSSPYGKTASSATSLSDCSPKHGPRAKDGRGSDGGASRSPFCRVMGRTHAHVVEHTQPASHVDQRVANVQAQDSFRILDLVHTDSGFDEAMLDLDSSRLTESGSERRPKTYVQDDDPSELEDYASSSAPQLGFESPPRTTERTDDDDHGRDVNSGVEAKRCASA